MDIKGWQLVNKVKVNDAKRILGSAATDDEIMAKYKELGGLVIPAHKDTKVTKSKVEEVKKVFKAEK